MSGVVPENVHWNDVLDECDGPGVELLRALVAEGALRASARALAEEEHLLGTYVDESQLDERPLRLAADDGESRRGGRVLGAGRLRVRVWAHLDQVWAEQVAGRRGITLDLAGGPVPLQHGVPVVLAGLDSVPARLVALDRRGRRQMLEPIDG